MVNNPEDFTIGRIWLWKSSSQKKEEKNLKPDLVLPFGYMYEHQMSLVQVAKKLNQVALLPNCDLVLGPDLTPGVTDEEKTRVGNENKEFRSDMLYLKKAIEHGTIEIETLPKS